MVHSTITSGGNMKDSEKVALIGLGVIGGLLAGAAIGLLLAPKTGKETRAMLKEKAEELKNLAKERFKAGMMPPVAVETDPSVAQAKEKAEMPVMSPLEIQTEEAAHPGGFKEPEAAEPAVEPSIRPSGSGRKARANVQARTINTALTPKVAPKKNVGGNSVLDGSGNEIGKLEGVMLDTDSGEIIYGVLVLNEGTAEEMLSAYPWPVFKETGVDRYTLAIAPEKMEKTVKFSRQDIPGQAELDDIDEMYDYYGYKHYWQKKRTGKSVPVENLK